MSGTLWWVGFAATCAVMFLALVLAYGGGARDARGVQTDRLTLYCSGSVLLGLLAVWMATGL